MKANFDELNTGLYTELNLVSRKPSPTLPHSCDFEPADLSICPLILNLLFYMYAELRTYFVICEFMHQF